MKMTVAEIIAITNGLNTFVEKDKEIPYAYARAISKNMKVLVAECEEFEMRRKKLVEGLNDKSEAEKGKVTAKLKEILETEIDLGIIMLDEKGLEDSSLTAKDYMALDFMFTANKESEAV